MHTQAYKDGHKDGYNNGYEWLTKGSNFRHPNAGGYIPGGPWVFTASRYDKPEYKVKAQKSEEFAIGWRVGWIDGINAYVSKNELSFAPVEYPSELKRWVI